MLVNRILFEGFGGFFEGFGDFLGPELFDVGFGGFFTDQDRTYDHIGSFSDHFRIIFRSFSDHFRIIFGSFSDHFRIIFGSFSDHFRIIKEWVSGGLFVRGHKLKMM